MLTEGLELIFVVIIASICTYIMGFTSEYIYKNFNENKKWIGALIDIIRFVMIIGIFWYLIMGGRK